MIRGIDFILRLALWLLLAPLLPGIINKVKAWVAGRRALKQRSKRVFWGCVKPSCSPVFEHTRMWPRRVRPRISSFFPRQRTRRQCPSSRPWPSGRLLLWPGPLGRPTSSRMGSPAW